MPTNPVSIERLDACELRVTCSALIQKASTVASCATYFKVSFAWLGGLEKGVPVFACMVAGVPLPPLPTVTQAGEPEAFRIRPSGHDRPSIADLVRVVSSVGRKARYSLRSVEP